MQFLKTIFWVILAVVAVIFSFGNWTPVTLNLWGDVQIDSKLPVLLFSAFLIGLLPTFILHRATRWRMRRKLESTERALDAARGYSVTTAPVVSSDPGDSIPPASIPTAVPPGVS
ncbi:lipopolysaccharide assembly protein LapA domain-containing protein [Sphingobium boeckii]|uniref:Putative integral membrane protein n=1 Tax=Sphingobium boeckii TaxID=1082345 RepID=A0A7W9AK67_9SPHN|nr:LapA family protein [Sphingobium boeckii]MBB5686949.1 putative integral membrane protein [Sphingobium boeckii]